MAHFVKEARMQGLRSFRNCFSEQLRERLERELGMEDCLRQLWPGLVGASLAANTQFHGLRGDRLMVLVPDRGWSNSLDSYGGLILEAVNRFWGKTVVRSIQCVEDPRVAAVPKAARTTRSTKSPELSPVLQAVGSIADQQLRAAFLESARKYFTRQEEHRS